MQQQESARWTYSGLFFAVMHNLNDIHQKDLVVLLVALSKVLRRCHRANKQMDALHSTVESFMASLLICNNNMIQSVQRISNGVEPNMNKWKSFATLMQSIGEKYLLSKKDMDFQVVYTTKGNLDYTETYKGGDIVDNDGDTSQNDSQLSSVRRDEDFAACLASDPSETLLAAIIQRSTMPKDFARLALVLYWLSRVGFPHDTLSSFFSMVLRRVIELEPTYRNDIYPRDIVSILKYSTAFDVDQKLKGRLYGFLSEQNRQSMLQLNIQDASCLLDCLLDDEVFDKGILVSIFTNLQLCMRAENMPCPREKAYILHSYLSQKTKLENVDISPQEDKFIGCAQLNDLADTFIRKDALANFMRRWDYAPFSDKASIGENHVDERRTWEAIIMKLKKICVTLEVTRPYCVALIEHLSSNRKPGENNDQLMRGR